MIMEQGFQPLQPNNPIRQRRPNDGAPLLFPGENRQARSSGIPGTSQSSASMYPVMKLQTSGRTSLCVRRHSATWRTVTSLKNLLFLRGGATAASVAANAALLRQMLFNTRTTARCASYVPNELPPLTRLDATAEAVPPYDRASPKLIS